MGTQSVDCGKAVDPATCQTGNCGDAVGQRSNCGKAVDVVLATSKSRDVNLDIPKRSILYGLNNETTERKIKPIPQCKVCLSVDEVDVWANLNICLKCKFKSITPDMKLLKNI